MCSASTLKISLKPVINVLYVEFFDLDDQRSISCLLLYIELQLI
jgi:hypothetical protein